MATQRSIFDPEPPAPKPPRAFHARAHVKPSEALAGEQRNRAQSAEILAVFRPGVRLTPWEAFDILGGRFPITSVRRCLTDSSRHGGPLEHHETDRRPSGPYQAMSGTWSLRA
jgi:hypothetical protein